MPSLQIMMQYTPSLKLALFFLNSLSIKQRWADIFVAKDVSGWPLKSRSVVQKSGNGFVQKSGNGFCPTVLKKKLYASIGVNKW